MFKALKQTMSKVLPVQKTHHQQKVNKHIKQAPPKIGPKGPPDKWHPWYVSIVPTLVVGPFRRQEKWKKQNWEREFPENKWRIHWTNGIFPYIYQ